MFFLYKDWKGNLPFIIIPTRKSLINFYLYSDNASESRKDLFLFMQKQIFKFFGSILCTFARKYLLRIYSRMPRKSAGVKVNCLSCPQSNFVFPSGPVSEITSFRLSFANYIELQIIFPLFSTLSGIFTSFHFLEDFLVFFL